MVSAESIYRCDNCVVFDDEGKIKPEALPSELYGSSYVKHAVVEGVSVLLDGEVDVAEQWLEKFTLEEGTLAAHPAANLFKRCIECRLKKRKSDSNA